MAKSEKQPDKKKSERTVKQAPKKGSVSRQQAKKAVKKVAESKGKKNNKSKGRKGKQNKRELTDKKRRFIEEYCIDYNATAAAKRAGYSEKTAYSIGHEYLRKPEISEAIKKRMDELSMSAEEAVKRLADWGRGDIAPFMDYDEDTNTLRIDLSKPEARRNLHLIKKLKQNDTIVKERSTKDREVIDRTFEIELHDAKDAVDKILKVHGKYIDNLRIEDVTPKPWDPDKGDPKDYVKNQITGGRK